ncbi:NFACT protein [Gracilaria domingensis]|nr:NFACT protein [Gracilaria domingensis]
MGLLDLRIETSILQKTLQGARVLNVYDAQNGRTYILKLSVPPSRNQPKHSGNSESGEDKNVPSTSVSQSWGKRLLLLESGARMHMTQFDREKDVPSGFCLKLRKHIRGRRLDSVTQLGDGGDRIMDLSFSGEGAIAAHLIVEAFSGGNVILTDADYTILTLLRVDRTKGDGEDGIVAVRERYPAEKARKRTIINKADFEAAVQRAVAAIPDDSEVLNAKGRHAKKKMQALTIARRALAYELAIEPSFLEHSLIAAGFDPEVSLKVLYDTGAESVYDAFEELESTLSAQMKSGSGKGYIILSSTEKDGETKEIYADFTPFLFNQYRNKPVKEFPTFDEAVDEYFSRIESQRAENAQAKREALAFKKVDKLASGLEGQVKVFENAREMSGERARAIEANIVAVDAAIKVVNSALAASVPWDGLWKMVQDEKKNGNPIAEIIQSLQLDKNQISLKLEFGVEPEEAEQVTWDNDEDNDYEVDSDREEDPEHPIVKSMVVPVDLGLGAHANARRHYEQQKTATAKMQKAVEVTDKTIKAASKKAANEAQKLEREAVVASIKARRVPLWLEKFYWFVSSENYLVVAGRDPHQNELLVKRYMGPADVYVNADVDGASSVIVKNLKQPESGSYDEIPQVTLDQAGAFAMCRSSAWDGKFITSAWWVRANQVAKTTPSGEYLPNGSFFIRGKKNFLTPNQLVMGIAFMFRVEDSCIEYHKGERCVRSLDKNETGERVGRDEPEPQTLVAPSVAAKPQSSNDPDVRMEEPKDEGTEVLEHEQRVPMMTGAPDNEEQSISSELKDVRIEQHPVTTTEIDEEHVTELELEMQPRSTKRYLSAKERKLRKKGRDHAAPAADPSGERIEQQAAPGKKKGASSSNLPNTKGPTPLPRGRKHKLKKMRKKYMDQDEEERNIALALLGSKPVKELEPVVAENLDEGGNPLSEEEQAEQASSEVDKKPGRRKRSEKQEGLRMSDPEGLKELGRLESECSHILDTLTAIPRAEDTIRYALPICAPYSALTNYRYRVKLMPGTSRRGKGYRAAVAVMLKEAEKDLSLHRQERDAMRLTPESEGIHMMLGNVKLMAKGLAEALKSTSKAARKKK